MDIINQNFRNTTLVGRLGAQRTLRNPRIKCPLIDQRITGQIVKNDVKETVIP